MSTKIHPFTTIYGMFGRVKFGLPHTWIEFFNSVLRRHLLNEREQFKACLGHSFPPPLTSMALFMMPIDLGKPIDLFQSALSFILFFLILKYLRQTNPILTLRRIIGFIGLIWSILAGLYFAQSNPFLGETGLVILNPFNITTFVAGLLAIVCDDSNINHKFQSKSSVPVPILVKKTKKKHH